MALREIGLGFGAKRDPAPYGPARGPGGGDRFLRLMAGRVVVELKVAQSAKTTLIGETKTMLETLAPHTRDPEDGHVSRLACVFDPDSDPREVFEAEMDSALSSLGPRWRVRMRQSRHRWIVARDDRYRVVVQAIAWRAPPQRTAVLPDHQNLERLMCEIARTAYPQEAALADRWLAEMGAATKKHPWKSAMHLWCALVEPKADEHSAPARFLHQNRQCAPHARSILSQVSLMSELRPLFTE